MMKEKYPYLDRVEVAGSIPVGIIDVTGACNPYLSRVAGFLYFMKQIHFSF
jgi:hypothetical protein